MLHSIHSPAKEQTAHNPTVVMLHGRGTDERNLFSLREYIDPRLEVFSVRAPFEFGWGGYTWFELFEEGTVDEESFRQSREQLLEFINALKREQLYLLGFSMGAIMAYSITLTTSIPCKGIACLSGFAPLQMEHEYKLQELQHLSIFISHGINDPVIPVSSARKTKELLDKSNAAVTYKEYRMAHEINEECLTDLRSWFSHIL